MQNSIKRSEDSAKQNNIHPHVQKIKYTKKFPSQRNGDISEQKNIKVRPSRKENVLDVKKDAKKVSPRSGSENQKNETDKILITGNRSLSNKRRSTSNEKSKISPRDDSENKLRKPNVSGKNLDKEDGKNSIGSSKSKKKIIAAAGTVAPLLAGK